MSFQLRQISDRPSASRGRADGEQRLNGGRECVSQQHQPGAPLPGATTRREASRLPTLDRPGLRYIPRFTASQTLSPQSRPSEPRRRGKLNLATLGADQTDGCIHLRQRHQRRTRPAPVMPVCYPAFRARRRLR
jgi:hypothetical protein